MVKSQRTKLMWSTGVGLLALLLLVRPALGDACVLTMGSQYQLKSDTVDWTMQTSSGQSCTRGLRHARVTIDTAKLISPPQSGQVKLLGPGFSYTANSDFVGQDFFTIQVSGMLNGIRGRRPLLRGGWWRRRQRGGIEQNVSKCGNIEKVIRYRPSHITASAEMSEFLPC